MLRKSFMKYWAAKVVYINIHEVWRDRRAEAFSQLNTEKIFQNNVDHSMSWQSYRKSKLSFSLRLNAILVSTVP